MAHDWEDILHTLPLGKRVHTLAIRRCRKCGVTQEKEQKWVTLRAGQGHVVAGYRWAPLVGWCPVKTNNPGGIDGDRQ